MIPFSMSWIQSGVLDVLRMMEYSASVPYAREFLLEITPPVYETVLEMKAECAKSLLSSWFASNSPSKKDTGVTETAMSFLILWAPSWKYLLSRDQIASKWRLESSFVLCLKTWHSCALDSRYPTAHSSLEPWPCCLDVVIWTRCLPYSWTFKYLVPSWWHSLWRLRSYGLAGGSKPVGPNFEVSKATCHSQFTLMDKRKLYLSIIPIPQTYTQVSSSV